MDIIAYYYCSTFVVEYAFSIKSKWSNQELAYESQQWWQKD